jgi:hypothetical protein
LEGISGKGAEPWAITKQPLIPIPLTSSFSGVWSDGHVK